MRSTSPGEIGMAAGSAHELTAYMFDMFAHALHVWSESHGTVDNRLGIASVLTVL